MDKHILIIDDDSRNIFALQAVLKAKGFSCTSATEASVGISLLRSRNDFGLVLLDMMMPEIDGYEALKLIKEDPEIAPVPLIAVTAQAMKGDKEKCLAAGADAYISKPVNVDELLELMKRYLKQV